MGDRIKRSDVRNMVRDYKSGLLFSQYSDLSFNFQRLQKIYVVNTSTTKDIEIGEPIFLTGIYNQNNKQNTISEYLTYGYIFSGTSYDDNHPERPCAIAQEYIKKSENNTFSIGECISPLIIPAVINSYDSNKHYATFGASGFVADTEGEYWIIGVNTGSETTRFGYLSLCVNPEQSGHLVGTIQSSITGNQKANVIVGSGQSAQTFTNIGCPLLGNNDTIAQYKKVVISKNQRTREWEIIEAQC